MRRSDPRQDVFSGRSNSVDTPSDDACVDTHAPGGNARDSGAGRARLRPRSAAAPRAASRRPGAQPRPSGPGSLLRAATASSSKSASRAARGRVDALRAAGAEIVDVSRRYQTVDGRGRPGDLRRDRRGRRRVAASRGADADPRGPAGRRRLRGRRPARRRRARPTSASTAAASPSASSPTPSTAIPPRRPTPPRTSPAATCRGPATPAATRRRSASSTTPSPPKDRRGPGDGADRPRPRAGRRDRLRHRVQRRTRLRRQHQGAGRRPAPTVIVDDVAYFEEPFFQDGPVAVAIDEVVAKGVTYFSAAGNDNLFEPRAATSPPGKRRNSATRRLPAGCSKRRSPEATDHCLDFDPGAGSRRHLRDHGRSQKKTLIVDLQWAEPWNGVDSRPRRLPARRGRRTADRRLRTVGSTADNVGDSAEAGRALRLGKRRRRAAEVQLAINRCFSTTQVEEKAATRRRRCGNRASS